MRLAPFLVALGLLLAGCVSAPKAPIAPQTTSVAKLPPFVVVANDVGLPLNASAAPPSLPTFVVHDLNTSAEEPTMGVDAKGNLYVGSAAITDTPARKIREPDVLKSTDHGKTWAAMATFPDEAPATLDPYLYVDQSTGRVFVDHLYAGCSWLSWSDDQGTTWGNDPVACGLPVNDHQTIVAGKPTNGTTLLGSFPNVVYYAYNGNYPSDAQSAGASSNVARSLDGGQTFLPAVLAIDGAHCGGLNGHLRTDKDGRVFIPGIGCDEPVLGISSDSGQTFTDVTLKSGKGRSAPGDDPSLGVDPAGGLYYAWPGKDAHMYLMTSADRGKTWSDAHALSPGIVTSSLEVTGMAGDPGRVAFAYYGSKTNTSSWKSVNSDDATPETTWYVFVTYSLNALDAHPTFTTVQLTPDDHPIQRGRIHNGGGSDPARNLLDFFDLVVDKEGRVYVAYTDGCHGCKDDQTSRAADLTVAVLDSGPSLVASVGNLKSPAAAAEPGKGNERAVAPALPSLLSRRES